jgi:hypothetical protein
MDHGYDNFIEGRITVEFWPRKSQVWEAELRTIDDEQARVEQARPASALSAAKTLERAKHAENLYTSQDPSEQRRLLETVRRHSTCSLARLK